MAPRSLWNGTVAFGLVTVPVKVFSATESKTVHFHEVHVADGSRIEHRRICPKDGKEVDYDHIVKGFEVRKGEWVELTDDEIAAAAGPQTRLIDVDHFVPADEIDPVFYERTYYLGAGDDGDDAYALLLAALEQSGRAGRRALGVPQPRADGGHPRARRRAGAAHACASPRTSSTRRTLKLAAGQPQAVGKREIEMAAKLVDGAAQEVRRRRSTRTSTARPCRS